MANCRLSPLRREGRRGSTPDVHPRYLVLNFKPDVLASVMT